MLSSLGDLSYMSDSFLSVKISAFNLVIILKTKQRHTCSLPKQLFNNLSEIHIPVDRYPKCYNWTTVHLRFNCKTFTHNISLSPRAIEANKFLAPLPGTSLSSLVEQTVY